MTSVPHLPSPPDRRVGRPRGTRRDAVAAAVLALAIAGCGAQIPFGTPGSSTGAVGGSASPGAGGSPGSSLGTSGAPAGSGGATAAPVTLAPGAAVYTVESVGLAITLPVGWVGYDATTPQALIGAAIAEHPEIKEALELLQAGLVLVAVDAAATGAGQAASMTVSSTGSAIPSRALLEALGQTTAGQIAASQPLDGQVAQSTIDLASGPAVNLVWQLRPEGDAEPLGFDAYLLTVGERTFAVTFVAPVPTRDGFQPVFRAIVESMRPA